MSVSHGRKSSNRIPASGSTGTLATNPLAGLTDDSYRRRQCHYFERDDAGFRRKYRPYRYTVHRTVCLGRFHLLRPSTLYRQRHDRRTGKSEARAQCTSLADTTYMWLGVTLRDSIDLTHRISLKCARIDTGRGTLRFRSHTSPLLRTGVALHTAGRDGVASCRIPGIATAPDGTLLAIYDARYDSARDLQGNIDIALQRSLDGGSTWTPMQPVLDMGTWGGLAEKHNGVSDACILVDRNTGRIFVAGLWMHGMLDADGKWIEGLDSTSDYWIHQWKGRGSQPGTDIRSTCQFLITHSDDGGVTWSFPRQHNSPHKAPRMVAVCPCARPGYHTLRRHARIPHPGTGQQGHPIQQYHIQHRPRTHMDHRQSGLRRCD